MSALVFALWLSWGMLIRQAVWDFNALSALFTGLAFGGLVVTVWIQLAEIAGQEESNRESLRAMNKIAEVLALSQMRQNTVSRIAHLKGINPKVAANFEQIEPDQIALEFGQLKDRLPIIELRIEKLTNEFLEG